MADDDAVAASGRARRPRRTRRRGARATSRVELVGDEPADVVRLDDLGQIALLVEHVGELTGGRAGANVRRSACGGQRAAVSVRRSACGGRHAGAGVRRSVCVRRSARSVVVR